MFQVHCLLDAYVQKQHKKTKKISKLTQIPESLDIGSCILNCLNIPNQPIQWGVPGLQFLACGVDLQKRRYMSSTLSMNFALITDQFVLKDLNDISYKCAQKFLEKLNMLELKKEGFKHYEGNVLLDNYDLTFVVNKNISNIQCSLYTYLYVQDERVVMDYEDIPLDPVEEEQNQVETEDV
jgi:hypothetical protein